MTVCFYMAVIKLPGGLAYAFWFAHKLFLGAGLATMGVGLYWLAGNLFGEE